MAADDEGQDEVYVAIDDDKYGNEVLVHFLEQQDEDAICISEFEDHIVEAVRESALAPVFASYHEARHQGGWFLAAKGRGGKAKARRALRQHAVALQVPFLQTTELPEALALVWEFEEADGGDFPTKVVGEREFRALKSYALWFRLR